MVNVNIEIPPELHKRLKVAAATDDMTLKDLVITLLAGDVPQTPAPPHPHHHSDNGAN